MRRIFLFGLLSLTILLLILGYHSVKYSDKNLHVIFCDVGQGDGIFIRTPEGTDIIIDGGPDGEKMLECLFRHMPIWDRKIEVIFLTHPDSDHLTGLVDVVRSYSVDHFSTSKAPKDTEIYKELMGILEEKNVTIHNLLKGDKVVTKDGISFVTFWPTKEFLRQESDVTNDYSLVQKMTYKDFDILFTGDVDAIYMNSIMPTVGQVDIFKLSHHGSKTGVDEFTFQHTVPQFGILSFGRSNKYGHPHPEVIAVLNQYKIPYANTLKGDIEIVSDGAKWSILPQ